DALRAGPRVPRAVGGERAHRRGAAATLHTAPRRGVPARTIPAAGGLDRRRRAPRPRPARRARPPRGGPARRRAPRTVRTRRPRGPAHRRTLARTPPAPGARPDAHRRTRARRPR